MPGVWPVMPTQWGQGSTWPRCGGWVTLACAFTHVDSTARVERLARATVEGIRFGKWNNKERGLTAVGLGGNARAKVVVQRTKDYYVRCSLACPSLDANIFKQKGNLRETVSAAKKIRNQS